MELNKFTSKNIIDSLNNETDKLARKKLQAFLLYKEGISAADIALKMSKHVSSIFHWIAQIKNEGLKNLQIKKGRGRKFLLSKNEFKDLKLALSKPINTEDRYTRGWQSKDVIVYIKEKYGIQYSFSRIRELLNIIGFRKIVCRPRSKRRNEKLTQEFLNNVKKKEICWVKTTN